MTAPMNTNNTQVAGEAKQYKKSVLELYVAAVEVAVSSKKTQQQVSASGHNFNGLNNVILAEAKTANNFKSNVWFSEKQMNEQNLMLKDENAEGAIVFTTKLVDKEGTNKKETVLRYWKVFNKDQLTEIPL